MNYELRITNYELRITNYELRITNYELPPKSPCTGVWGGNISNCSRFNLKKSDLDLYSVEFDSAQKRVNVFPERLDAVG